jgi:hypothetical protein
VARQLAGLLSGEVTMESEPGQGCIFTVRLPMLPATPEAPAAAAPMEETSAEQRVKGRRIAPRRGVKPPSEQPERES